MTVESSWIESKGRKIIRTNAFGSSAVVYAGASLSRELQTRPSAKIIIIIIVSSTCKITILTGLTRTISILFVHTCRECVSKTYVAFVKRLLSVLQHVSLAKTVNIPYVRETFPRCQLFSIVSIVNALEDTGFGNNRIKRETERGRSMCDGEWEINKQAIVFAVFKSENRDNAYCCYNYSYILLWDAFGGKIESRTISCRGHYQPYSPVSKSVLRKEARVSPFPLSNCRVLSFITIIEKLPRDHDDNAENLVNNIGYFRVMRLLFNTTTQTA